MPVNVQDYGDELLHAKWALLIYIVQATPDQTPFWYLKRYNDIAPKMNLPTEDASFAVPACKALKERGMFSVGYNYNDRPIYHMRKVMQYQHEFAELYSIVTPMIDVADKFQDWVVKNKEIFQ